MKRKILIAVPSLGDVDMSFAASLTYLTGYTLKQPNIHLVPAFLSSSLLPDLRNSFVEIAKENNCTHILFLDADMKFPPDLLMRLLSHDKDIITTNYVTKSETTSRFTATGLDGQNHRTKRNETGISEIALGATGTMLINMRVFDKLKKPYFWLYYDKANDRGFGEDYYFCHKAREKGFKVWIDNDLTKSVFHIGRKEYSIEDAIRCIPYHEKAKKLNLNGLLTKNSSKSSNSKAKRSKRSNKPSR